MFNLMGMTTSQRRTRRTWLCGFCFDTLKLNIMSNDYKV